MSQKQNLLLTFENYYVASSKNGGIGNYASRSFKKNQVITIFQGTIIPTLSADWSAWDDLLDIDEDFSLLLDGDSHYFNHSCDPNCTIVGLSTLVAIKEIAEDEELTFDYSLTVEKYIENNWLQKYILRDFAD